MIIKVNHQPSGGREWVAEITGRHPKFQFERKFLTPVDRKWSSSGKTGWTFFEVEEGKIYQVQEPFKGRYFITIRDGKEQILDVAEVLEGLTTAGGR